jgi:hypothetical protein
LIDTEIKGDTEEEKKEGITLLMWNYFLAHELGLGGGITIYHSHVLYT